MTPDPHRILVVDDNPLNLKLAGDVLESEGNEVRRAEDAESCLTVLDEWKPEVILMDLALPHVDGFTLTRHIKLRPDMRDVCIIAVTAFAMKGDDAKAIAAGCDGYIPKPLDTRRLGQQIEEALGRARSDRAAPTGEVR